MHLRTRPHKQILQRSNVKLKKGLKQVRLTGAFSKGGLLPIVK